MAADGSVVLEATIDDKQTVKVLAGLKSHLKSLERDFANTGKQKSGLEEKLSKVNAEMDRTGAKLEELQAKYRESKKWTDAQEKSTGLNSTQLSGASSLFADKYAEQASLQKQIAELLPKQDALYQKANEYEAALQKVNQDYIQQQQLIDNAKSRIGQIEGAQVQQANGAMQSLRNGAEAAGETATKAIPSFSKLFKGVLKWGFGIRSVFILVRKLKQAVVEYYTTLAKSDKETKDNLVGMKSALAELKGAFGAAFAPIINAVTPLLQTLIKWLTAAANAVARFTAVLSGATSYKKAVANTAKIQAGLEGVGGAAAEANKELAAFDELNVLSDNSGGGGGGGGNSDYNLTDEAIDMQSFGAKMALNIKDILFNWTDINPEVVAKKLLGALGMLTGGALGFAIGGIPGAIIGAVAGLLITANVASFLFNDDGTLNKDEIIKSILVVLGAALGGIAGFVLGGPAGAAFGIVLGAALMMAAGSIKFEGAGDIGQKFKKWLWDDGILAMWNEIKILWQQTIESFKFDPPHVKLPHLNIDWKDAGGLAKFFGISSLPSLSVSWYARGGIVNSPTLFGAGEAGKEAVIPLERHTEWIKMVADGIADILIDRFAGAMPAMPAMAGGSIIPPQMEYAMNRGVNEGDAKLLSMLQSIYDKLDDVANRPVDVNSPVYIDKRKIGEAVTEYQRNTDRARGR